MKQQDLFNLTEITSHADISDCGKYRYTLTRIWDEGKPKVMFVMLNPSTADADVNDPTIRRCIGFAKSWGYGGLYVCNIFAFRSTDPKKLLEVGNPFGDENLWHTKRLSDKVEVIVCAWGNKPVLKKILKDFEAYRLLEFAANKLHYLSMSKQGIPKHPLYLKSNLLPIKLSK